MFVRLFVDANDENEALNTYQWMIKKIENYIKSEEIKKIEPYWKIEGVFIIETQMEFIFDATNEMFMNILNCISDKWIFSGIPVDEALASVDTEGCNYIIDGLKLINIFY
jgi:hypothetical protein